MPNSTLLKVDGNAWSVAKDVENQIKGLKTSRDIVSSLGLNYTVSAHNVKTDIEEPVPNYWGMYRDDTNKFLGISVCETPNVIQNVDTFDSVESMIDDSTFTPVCADSYNEGRQFWGCFKFDDSFDVLGDTIDQYFIIVNDHLKPNGNVSVISTPVRIACMNAMSFALSRSTLKFTIPAIVDDTQKSTIAASIENAYSRTAKAIKKSSEKLAKTKISKDGIQRILDDLFPYIEESADGTTNHDRANAFVNSQREAFLTCLSADNLENFNGTAYQVYNALTDFATHYYRNGDKGFSLENRMTVIPGMNSQAATNGAKVTKFLKSVDSFALAA